MSLNESPGWLRDAMAIVSEHRIAFGILSVAVALFLILMLLQQIPIKYTLRSLRARWVSSLMTVAGTALVVWASVLSFGLSAGLDHTLEVSGDPLDIIVLRKGADSETASTVEESMLPQIEALDGVQSDEEGTPLVSGERVIVVNTSRRKGQGNANLIVRGMGPVGFKLRPDFKLVQGEMFQTGVREAITSRSIADRFEGAGLGEELKVLGGSFRITGIFDAGDTAAESEVWTSNQVLSDATDTSGGPAFVSSVQVRASGPEQAQTVMNRLINDPQFGLKAIPEKEYFSSQSTYTALIKYVGQIVSIVLAVGAMFSIANTMFGALASRAREVGTLRALGFSRLNVLTSFLVESLVLCLFGGLLGCLGTVPLHGLTTGTGNWATFSEITFAFRFTWLQMMQGTAMAVAMGVFGGFLPAFRATRLPIINALREV